MDNLGTGFHRSAYFPCLPSFCWAWRGALCNRRRQRRQNPHRHRVCWPQRRSLSLQRVCWLVGKVACSASSCCSATSPRPAWGYVVSLCKQHPLWVNNDCVNQQARNTQRSLNETWRAWHYNSGWMPTFRRTCRALLIASEAVEDDEDIARSIMSSASTEADS